MQPKHIAERRPLQRERQLFPRGSGTRIIMSPDEAALIRLSHEQNVHMKSQKGFAVITGNPRAAKSATAQAQWSRPIRRKCWRARRGQRQTAANLTTLMTGIRRFMKAYAILWQKLYARFSEHTFDQGDRVLVSRVATHLDIPDRVSMKTGRLGHFQNRPIERQQA